MNAATRFLALTSSFCPDPSTVQEGARFHTDQSCDKDWFNQHKRRLEDTARGWRLQRAAREGSIASIPNQKTVFCPLDPQQFAATDPTGAPPSQGYGFDTTWIVENTASTPIVLSYINSAGVEVSALDSRISPPEADPNAILQPRQWLALQTFEGHLFQAREILTDGSAGQVLLQHRPGLIPIGEMMQGQITDCPLVDVEPIYEGKPTLQRTPPRSDLECNTVYLGFRNMAGCPLNGFFVSPTTSERDNTGVQCEENFKFHLGVQTVGLNNPLKDWTSATMFEASQVGRTFSFRLAHDNTFVQSYTLRPTQVPDCPDRKQAIGEAVPGEDVKVGVARQEQDAESDDATEEDEVSTTCDVAPAVAATTGSVLAGAGSNSA